MAILPIVVAPDRRLKTPCKPVVAVDDDIRTLMKDMLDTMYDAPGIGLAAPQVGRGERVIVCDVAGDDEPPTPMMLANPEIVEASDEHEVASEGCLSLPEVNIDVERPAAVRVRYLDEDGETQEMAAEGLLARCLQHEIDHLDGVLILDHASALKRSMALKKLAKQRRGAA